MSLDDVKLISEVRKIRKERGVSQSFLANKLGITSQQMHKYEVGTDRLPATYLWKIANALGVNIDTFFSANVDPSFKEGQNNMITFEKDKYELLTFNDATKWREARNNFIPSTSMAVALFYFCEDMDIVEDISKVDKYIKNLSTWYYERKMTGDARKFYDTKKAVADPGRQAILDFGHRHEEDVAIASLQKLKQRDESFLDATLESCENRIYYVDGYHFSATLDYIIRKKDGSKALLECKTRQAYIKNNEQEVVDRLFDKYRVQVQVQQLATGIEEAYIGMCRRLDKIDKIDSAADVRQVKPNATLQRAIIQASDDCYNWLDDCLNGRVPEPILSREEEDGKFLLGCLEEFNALRAEAEKPKPRGIDISSINPFKL